MSEVEDSPVAVPAGLGEGEAMAAAESEDLNKEPVRTDEAAGNSVVVTNVGVEGEVAVEISFDGATQGTPKEAVKDGGGQNEKETATEDAVDGGKEKSEKAAAEENSHPSPPQGILKHFEPVSGEGETQQVTEELPHKKHGKKGDKPKKELVPLWRLFRFADCWDILMIIVGFFVASLSGLGLPVHASLFGRVINNFVFYSAATDFINGTMTFSDQAHLLADSLNTSCERLVADSPNVILAFATNRSSSESSPVLCDNDIFNNILDYICDPTSTLRYEIGLFSVGYVAMATAVLIFVFVATIFWNVSAYRQTRRIRQAFYHSILHQEIGWFDVNEANELSTRLADDVEKIQAGIGDKVSLFLNYFSTFVGGFVVAFFFNWKMALVVGVMLPLLAFMAGVIAKIVATFTVREQSAYASAGAVAEEVLSSIRTVAAFGGEDREAQRYEVQLVKARKEGLKKGFFSSLVIGGLYLVIFSTFALGFWYGSTLVIDCELSAGDVVTVFFAVIIGSFSLGNALPELETFGTALGAAAFVFKVIDRKPVIDASSDEGEIPDSFEGNVKFSDVVFHYPARPSVQVLKGLDLEIKHGQTVALVGPSGCGKSTVIQLIQRFYNPNGGQVTIDERPIADLNLRWLRSQIGVVSQEPVLFDTTIAENIRFGWEGASLEAIQAAAKKANAHDFICKLPDGYDTDVGERGAQLSGGQKQRIAIARALVRDPKLLLLDEATSALDTESEKVVQEALDKAREGRTTIVIAHRLSTIQNADIIVSIQDGRVLEHGTHLELMDKEGLYHELVTAQTIVEEEESSEGLAGFRAAVKRTISQQKTREGSVSGGGGKTGYARMLSSASQHSIPKDDSVFGLSDHLSHFSIEDLPIAAAPSPFPGRRTFPGGDENVLYDEEEGKVDEPEEEVVEEEEGKEDDRAKVKMRPSTVRRLVRRRQKVREEDLKQKPVTFRELLKLNLPDWPLVLIGVIMSAIIGVLFPLQAILFSDILRVYGLADAEAIENATLEIVGGFLALAVGSCLVYFTASFTLAIAGERLTKRLRLQTFQAMLRQEIGWFDQKAHSTGALATRLATDAAEVKGATGIRLGTILQTIFGLIAATVIAFVASWELSLIMILAFPILGTVAFFQIRLLAGRAKKNKKRLEASGQTAVESIDSIRTVVGLGVEQRFFDKYKDLLAGPFRDNIKSVFVTAVVLSLAQSFVFYLFGAGFSFGAFLVLEGRVVYDDIFQVFGAIVFTAFSLGRASSFAPDANKAKIAASRILTLLDRKPLIDVTSTEGQRLDTTSGDIAVKSVHFNYPARPEVQVLQGMEVAVKPGQTLALVGPSGCGKSTVVSLVERFYDPVLGSVMLEGVDLRDLNLKWLRTQIGIVSQEPVLFDASIAENIRYGALFRGVSDDEVIEAAKSANIHSFIESLPEGYGTNVGAKGTQLSGGQKQRIAIARALVRDPKVLLLDEATSALDTESEKVVQEALDKAREGRTSIVIAHRLSTIYNSDIIAVIHNGQVIESGTHSQLMAQRGAYYLLNTVQLEEEEKEED